MKSFLKYVLATIVGLVIVNGLLLFLGMMFIGVMTTFTQKIVTVPDNSVLTVKLNTPIYDRTSENPLDEFDFLSMDIQPNIGLNKILASIDAAAHDVRIEGIYLDLTDIPCGLATLQDIRNALLRFKKSGKFIYSYSNFGYSQKSYYLASVADSVFVNPETPLMLTGISSGVTFFKDALEKLGIRPEIVKVGKFKSAVEPFIANEMSDANREQMQRYLDVTWANLVNAIAESRNIPADSINALTDRVDAYTTEQFRQWGYFDRTLYEDEMIDVLKRKLRKSDQDRLPQISLTDYQSMVHLKSSSAHNNKIAIVYASGEIGMKQTAQTIGPELAQTIRKIRKNDQIKAVVLRVNSPGGSALTSDIIWREVKLTQEVKPVIVSMGDLAASGGYYISCAADTIVAEPTTLTGSIGIFGMFFSGEELINDKLGIHTDVVKTNEHSDFGGISALPIPLGSRTLTPYEKQVLQNHVNTGYETFLSRVMDGRHIGHDELHEIAQGRVWTGEDALRIGLVDVMGGLEDAIAIAASKAEVEDYTLAEYPLLKNPMEELFLQLSGGIKMHMLQEEMGPFYTTWKRIKEITGNQGIMARLPFDLTIY